MREIFQKHYRIFYWSLALIFSSVYAWQIPGDFHIFIQASSDVIKGVDVYTKLYKEWYHYFYGLSFAVIIYPLTLTPLKLAAFIWLLLNFYFLFTCIKRIAVWTKLNTNIPFLLFLFVTLFCIQFLLQNFRYGQVTILVLFCVIETVEAIINNKPLRAGIFLAMGIHIKLLPLVLIPWLIYRKEWKATIFTFAFLLMLYLAPVLFIGKDSFLQNMKSWYALINPSNEKHVIDTDERSFHGLSTLLATLLIEKVPDYYALDIKRNIANIQVENLNTVLNIVRLIFICSVIFVFSWPPFKKIQNAFQAFKESSYLLCLIPLIFPHQQHYAFLLCWPAAIILCVEEWKSNGQFFTLNKIILILILICFNLSLFLGEFTEYYEHFKIITYAAILIVILFLIRSKRLRAESL